MTPPASTKSSIRDRQTGIEKHTNSVRKLFVESRYFRWFLLMVITSTFIFILYPHLVVTRPFYQLGDVAGRDIKAPKDFLVEDQAATEINRRRAVEEVLTVYDHDTALMPALKERIEGAFFDLQTMMADSGNRQVPNSNQPATSSPVSPLPETGDTSPKEKILQQKNSFSQRLGIDVSTGAYRILLKEEFSSDIADGIIRILSKILEKGVVTNKAILLRESNRGIILRGVETQKERVIKDLKQFYGLDQAKSMVRII